MPKIKKGLDYFDLQTDVCDDKRIKLLRAEFGIKGFGIWVELLRQIYADEGYFIEWDNDTKLLFASDVGESGGVVDEVIKGSVKRGLFNESVFDQFNVLTSEHIQMKYFDAIKRRTSEIKVDGRYLVINQDEPILKDNVNIKILNVNISAQRRGEERKENYIPPNARNPREADDDGPQHKPDSLDAVVEFFANNQASPQMAEDFFDYYDSQGWVKPNGMAITSWQSAANQWIRREKHNPPDWKQKSKRKDKGGNNGTNGKSKGDRHVDALQAL